MRFRDYLLMGLLGVALFLGLDSVRAGLTFDEHGPRTSLVRRTARWLAIWWLTSGDSEAPPPSIQELPAELVNHRPHRLAGPDGAAILDHAAGW